MARRKRVVPEREKERMTCPVCGAPDVRLSQHTSLRDSYYALLNKSAWRCRKCRIRFYAPSAPGEARKRFSIRKQRRNTRRRLGVNTGFAVLLGAAALLIFLLFLRYLTSESRSEPSEGALDPGQQLCNLV